jgi:hypothetical protein
MPRQSTKAMFESLPAYHRDLEYLKLSNKALRVMPGSIKQKEIQARMREIERRYKRESNPLPRARHSPHLLAGELVAEKIIRKHYGLSRRLDPSEVQAEISNLRRKHEKGLLDDSQQRLWARLYNKGFFEREGNPIRRVKGGYRWGGHGHVYPTRAGALRQARAAFAHGYREKNPMRISNKNPGEMSASQINAELDRLSAEDSKVNSELIAAGRGHEKYWDILKKDDPLSRKALALVSRRHKLMIEVERRAGPGMHRLPRGFGPIRNPVYQTVRLNNGVVVLAKDYKGRPHAYTYANLTQAKKKATEVGGYVTGHRPYYIAIETGTDRVSNPARRLYYRVRR